MKTIKFTDKASIGAMHKTQEGFLVSNSRVARTGVQDYLASELGMLGDHVVKVMRHEDEVFSKDSINSLCRAPITIDHPSVMVDADNWGELAVGEVGDNVLRDGEWITLNPMIKDAAGVKAAETTHKEISMGYTARLVDAPKGADYDLEMKDIRFNHLALVPKGRAGSEARIGDSADNWGAAPQPQKEVVSMEMKTIVVGDEAVQVAVSDAGKFEKAVEKIKSDHAAVIDAKDTEIGELKAECADANSKVLSDADIEALVVDRTAVIAKALTLDADIDVTGKTVAEIKREAVRSVHGDEAAGVDVSDAEIKGIFNISKPAKVDDKARDVLKQPKKQVSDGNINWAEIQEKGAK